MADKKTSLDLNADTRTWSACVYSPHPSSKCPYGENVLECAAHDVGCRMPK